MAKYTHVGPHSLATADSLLTAGGTVRCPHHAGPQQG